jgi:outer membrane protein assembly factor BamB
LVALRAASGTVAWGDSLSAARGRNSLADLSAVRGRPAIRDGRVYATSLGGLLVSLDLRTGRRLWEREVTSSESPWAAGDWLFIVSSEGQVAAIARQNGAAAWVTQLDRYEDMEASKGPILWVGPVLAGDRLVVVGTNSMALSLSPYTGEVLGQQALPGRAAVAPSVAGGTLFLLTDDATLSAFR